MESKVYVIYSNENVIIFGIKHHFDSKTLYKGYVANNSLDFSDILKHSLYFVQIED
jgi:hypothetical protein